MFLDFNFHSYILGLVVQLRIQQIWNEDLEDKNSQAFKELSETLVIQARI